jgi:cellulose synthase/poly-beta-1,6-N-acetylglucosamine synthase-like glycosyltransferase
MVATVIFLLSMFVLLYIGIGYPLITAALARCFPRPIRKGHLAESVSVIIAVHNGANFIVQKLESLLELQYPRDLLEFIVASDGSTDETDALVERFSSEGVRLLRLARAGKASALNEAMRVSSGRIVFFTDVRQVLNRECVQEIVNCFADPSVGVVSGELIIGNGTRSSEGAGLYWRYEKWIRKHLSSIDSIFGATGACYAMRRELLVPLPASTLLDDMFLPLNAFFRGYRLVMEPRAVAYDVPVSLDTEFRRKVRTLAGNYQILAAYPGLLGPRNRMWLHYVSYKFSRLLVPWVVIVGVVSGLLLPAGYGRVVCVGVILWVGAVFIDPVLSRGSPIRRVTAPARMVAVLAVAAAWAVSVLFVPPERLWRHTSVSR